MGPMLLFSAKEITAQNYEDSDASTGHSMYKANQQTTMLQLKKKHKKYQKATTLVVDKSLKDSTPKNRTSKHYSHEKGLV